MTDLLKSSTGQTGQQDQKNNNNKGLFAVKVGKWAAPVQTAHITRGHAVNLPRRFLLS